MNTIVLAVRDTHLFAYHEAIYTQAYDPTDTVTMLNHAERVINDHTDIGENRLYIYDSGTTVELLCAINAARECEYESVYIMCKGDCGHWFPVEMQLRGED